MSENVTVIDIVAQVTDQTAAGAASATQNVSKLEKAMQKVQAEINKMKKMSKLELTMYAIDKASKGIDSVMKKGGAFAGKVFSATVSVIDKVTAPIRGIISKIGDLIGITGLASAALGGLTIHNALNASASQSRAETQLATVLRNNGKTEAPKFGSKGDDVKYLQNYLNDQYGANLVVDGRYGRSTEKAVQQYGGSTGRGLEDVFQNRRKENNDSILKRANELQGQTMYSGTSLTAGAAEFATYLTDTKAIEQMMGTLTDYAAGMSGGIELNEQQMVDYATQLGKALNAEDAAFDGLKKKGFAVSEAQEKILKSSLTSDLQKTAALSEIIAESWEGMAKQFAKTPTGKITQVKNKWDDIQTTIGQKLEPSVGRFFDMLDSRLPGIGNLLTRGADALGGLFDRLIPSIERGIDGAISGIEKFSAKLSEITNRPEFQEASFFGKVKILWDEIIAKPFAEWWSNKGKVWMGSTASQIGRGLGSAIKWGVSALFGIDAGGVIDDGLNIGKSFADGFGKGMEGLDWSKVAEGLKDALMGAIKLVFSNPVTGAIAGTWLGGKVLGGISGGYKAVKSVKGAWNTLFGAGAELAENAVTNGGGIFGGISQGLQIAKAAKAGGPAAQSALTFAQAGKLGVGAKIGSAGMGGMALGAAGIAGGVIGGATLISAATDFYKGMKSDNNQEADAYKESAGWKAGGVAAGAIAGAAIGSVIPVVGTVVGGLIGAGIGGIAGWVMGDNSKKRYEEAMAQEKEAEAAAFLAKEQAKYADKDLKAALADTSVTAEEFNQMFQKKVVEGLQKRFGDITLTLQEIQGIAKGLTFGNATESLNAFAAATADVNNDLANLQNTGLALKKINWKLDMEASAGIVWQGDVAGDFTAAAEEYINAAQSLLGNKHYEATMAFRLIMGEDDGSGLVEAITGEGGLYAKLQEQMNEILAPITLPNGTLRLDDREEVNSIIGQISEITDKVTAAQNEAKLEAMKIKYGGAEMDYESFARLQQELPGFLESAISNYDEALTTGLVNLKLQAELDPDFDYEAASKTLTDKYLENIHAIENQVFEFQMDAISIAFADDAEYILPDFEGDLRTRLETALTGAMTLTDNVKAWDSDTWVMLLGLEDNTELAGKLETVLNPIAQSMSSGFLDSFGVSSAQAADAAQKMFQKDIESHFAREISMGATVTVRANTIVQYANDKLGGREGTFGSLNPYDTNNTGTGHRIQYPVKELTPEEQARRDALPKTELHAMPKRAEGGIFGAYADGGILDKRGLKPIGAFTDSSGIMGAPHVGLVGEDGAESIIPLSPKRRKRGIALWEKAGQLLGIRPKESNTSLAVSCADGIRPHAEGGIFGAYADGGILDKRGLKPIGAFTDSSGIMGAVAATMQEQPDDLCSPKWSQGQRFGADANISNEVMPLIPQTTASGGTAAGGAAITVPVTIDEVTLEVKIDSDSATNTESIVQILKENIKNLTDEIAHSIAISLEQVFANLPAAATEE